MPEPANLIAGQFDLPETEHGRASRERMLRTSLATPLPESREAWRQECNEYLSRRVGTYDFRCRRYDAVIEKMNLLGVAEWDVAYDLGAGMCELDRRLRDRGLHLRYVPVDGCIDGTDLNDWTLDPGRIPPADVYVAIEVIEHLQDPLALCYRLFERARKGVIVTTPNARRVDVLGMDETHRWALTDTMLQAAGFQVEARQLFNDFEDTLVAWRAT